jgi:heterotetrameric sarcosine oxidase gamma subunit
MSFEHESTRERQELPSHAQVVIVGGGIIGCNLAYHLAKQGCRDVVLLERKQLSCGTTWHAAGLVLTAFLESETSIELARYSQEFYATLEAETGQPTGFKRPGYIMLCSTSARLTQLRRTTAVLKRMGIGVYEISGAEVNKLSPLVLTDDVIAAFYCPEEAVTNPVDTTIALAKGARDAGARIFEDIRVTGVTTDRDRVTGVTTRDGKINAEFVVNCCGMWAREFGLLAGVSVPLHAAEHYYMVTEPFEGMTPDFPILADEDRFAYYREEVGGLMLGLFEPEAAPWGMQGIPEDFCFSELTPNWQRMMPYLDRAIERIPAAKGAGIRKLFCGPESFTPDNTFYVGESPELRNYFVAAGFNSSGILFGGGVGNVLAHWIIDGYPPMDLSEVNIDRVVPFQNSPVLLRERTAETLGYSNGIHWPNRQFATARDIRRSVLHDRLARAGACFAQSATGWEYADWYAPKGVDPEYRYSWGRQNWFGYNADEHRAAREGVVLFDLSLMSKFLMQGRDAEAVLNRICANDIAVPAGRCVYTQWLNERGTIEADLTVSRLGADTFLVVAPDLCHAHVRSWLERHIPSEAHVTVTDVTSAYTVISIQGPTSRELLSQLTDADLTNEGFPFRTIMEIDLHGGHVLALRLSYVGELGWELYAPTEFAQYLYDAIVQKGSGLGLRHAGMQTLNSLRIEKAYRDFNHDVNSNVTPLEAGLGFAVAYNKPFGFIGSDAILRQRESGSPKRRLVQFRLQDPEPIMYHDESIYLGNDIVGSIKTAAYGHTLGAAVGLGYLHVESGVTRKSVEEAIFEIDIAGKRHSAIASIRPMYDPDGERLRS